MFVEIVRIVVSGSYVTEELLTVAEAARRLGLSPKSVQSMVRRRELPAVVIASRTRIPASAVQELADRIEAVTASAAELARRLVQQPPDDQEARQ